MYMYQIYIIIALQCVITSDQLQPTSGVALSQQQYTYHHNHSFAYSGLQVHNPFADHQGVRVYADFNGFCFNESPQKPGTYRPDLILYNFCSSLMGIIELTFPLDSEQHN